MSFAVKYTSILELQRLTLLLSFYKSFPRFVLRRGMQYTDARLRRIRVNWESPTLGIGSFK